MGGQGARQGARRLSPSAELEQATEVHIALPIETPHDLAVCIEAAFGVIIPSVSVCHGHSSPWDAFVEAYFARVPVSVWKASRGFGGKSHLLATLANIEAATLDADVNIIGGSGLQSQRVLAVQASLWSYPRAPRDLLASDPTRSVVTMAAGNTVTALTASTRAARGPHPQRLRLDEVDEMPPIIFDAAMGQTMGRRDVRGNIILPAQTVISSTQQYAAGMMARVLQDAATRNWPVHEWCYRETLQPHGWNPQSEVDRKRGEVTEAMWRAEYDLQEPNPGALAFDADKCDACFSRALGTYEGRPGEVLIFEPPQPNGRYAHGSDWARTTDFTVHVTWRVDVRPIRLVAFQRVQKLPWPIMVGYLVERVKAYSQPPATRWVGAHDGTGLGDVIEGYLPDAWKAPFVDELPIMESVVMMGSRRRDLLSEYINAVENGELIAPYITSMRGEHRYAGQSDVYGAPGKTGGHLPDTISAGALGLLAARRARAFSSIGSFPVAVGAENGQSYWRGRP